MKIMEGHSFKGRVGIWEKKKLRNSLLGRCVSCQFVDRKCQSVCTFINCFCDDRKQSENICGSFKKHKANKQNIISTENPLRF